VDHLSELRFDDIAELESRELFMKSLAVEEVRFPDKITSRSA